LTEQNTATASKQNNKANSFGGWGWSMIFMCMIAYFIGGGINTDGLNIFVGALSGARGWDRAAMLSWSTYGGWIAILFTFIFGHIIVKKGAKVVFVGTLFLTAIAIYFYGHTQNFAVYAISVAACSILSAGYSLTAPNTIQANWFPRKKGLALGWSTIGYPLCTMIFPFVTNFLMGNFGVESMFTAIAVFVLIFAVISIFWCKNTPEEVGRAPDNDPLSAEEIKASQAAARAYKSPWTMKRLLKTPQTWLIGIGMGLLWMVTVAIVSQLVSRLMGAGYERTAAVGMLSVMGFFGIFGSYIWGFIDLKIGTRKATYIYAAWYAVALLLLIFMANTVTIYLGVFMVGISVGGICNLIPSMIGSVFGRYDFAAASRFISAVTKGICACAYLYNAQSLKLTGSLTAGYVGLIVLCGVAALLVFLIKPVVKPQN